MAEKLKATNAQLNQLMMEKTQDPTMEAILENGLQENDTEGLKRVYEGLLEADSSGKYLNDYFSTLLNMCIPYMQKNRAWNNPLEDLRKDRFEYGNAIEEIYTNLFDIKNYDPNKPDNPWEQNRPDIKSAIHFINSHIKIPYSVNEEMLRKAMLSPTGVSGLLNQIQTQFVNTDKQYRYEQTVKLLTDAYKFNGMKLVRYSDSLSTAEDAKKLTQTVRELIMDYGFISKDHNKTGCDTFTLPEDVILFITPRVRAMLDVQVLAESFNMDKADFLGHVKIIRKFGNTGCDCVVCDREAFLIFDQLYRVTSLFDPANLNLNTWLHDWAGYNFSKFMNATALTTDVVYDSNVTAVSVTASSDTVAKGGTLQITATVTGDESNAVYYQITGTPDYSTTYISDEGMLYVSKDEKSGTKIVVTCYAKKNNEIKGTKTVTVQ